MIEVADSSLEYDRETKLPLYAKANIPETQYPRYLGSFLEPGSAIERLRIISRLVDLLKGGILCNII